MTREQRCELLALAREAKAAKKLERDADKPILKRGRKPKQEAEVIEEPVVEKPEPVVEESEPEPEPVKKPRAKKAKETERSLVLEMPDDEPEIIYETEYRKRPKKKIVKKIIYEDDSDDEVEEVIIDNRKKKSIQKPAQVKKILEPVPLEAPKEPDVK